MRIDAHQHYWRIERGDYGWITPELPVLYRDYLPADLAPLLKEHRLDGTVAVQAAPTFEETDFLLALADREPSILAVVGWLDLFDARHREHFERWRRHSKFAGFRLMIQEMPDASRILEPAFVDALREYEEADVPVDLLVRSDQLEPLLGLLRQVPNLRGVIDHLAKPPIRAGRLEPWRSQMRDIAAFPRIRCKLSGMVTEAEPRGWKPADLVPYTRAVLELFGPRRVLFGSDWPVCLLTADYGEVVDALLQALPAEWGERELTLLFGENAKEFYKL